MDGSRTIQVRKRDGNCEPFQRSKLAGAIWRAMEHTRGRPEDARSLAEAIELHLRRTDRRRISSKGLFEMVLKVLRKIHLPDAAGILETHHLSRTALRQGLLVYHGPGKVTLWDKSWLGRYASRAWQLSPATGRILAGQVEAEILAGGMALVTRVQVLRKMNECVAAFGLADAVTIGPEMAEP